ncbi:MAG: glycoside hydrolase family 2 TIM barrel-domain containing protein [Lachnospiraceae bacterium]
MGRNIQIFNSNWQFKKLRTDHFPEGEKDFAPVTLPHTWNAADGQDGGNDFDRGLCLYRKHFEVRKEPDREYWLEVRGAAMTASVTLNGKMLYTHAGGYSTFRVNLTEGLFEGENTLDITCDNGRNDTVYPQKADFTFYGGLYRDVFLLEVPRVHFALGYHGTPGIRVTPLLAEDLTSAEVTVEAWLEGPAGTLAGREVELFAGGQKKRCLSDASGHVKAEFTFSPVHLWNGKADPYLYTAAAVLAAKDGTGMDKVSTRFGCRRFLVNPERGFFLNGKPYRLCGAARHQDRPGKGSAISKEDHEEDIALLLEMGANTVRLAHYQQDSYFYDLCDEKGLIVWAEIPYITAHMPAGRQNTLDQMTELVLQNYNHPSIICWGLSNEITGGGKTEDLVENHRLLNDLCHHLDPTRLTTMANIFMLDPEDPLVFLPDIRSFNLYYGWYVGELSENDRWFDRFHEKHPDQVIGLSEYGADANPQYQTGKPQKGDWTEEYQALYHEHMLQMWSERPYIWAMHAWNMFDFAADGRDEGGKPGQNQKGLVTFDRKLKKDAFYIYKAWLSDEPFVHLCGRRYVNRTENPTEVKVYSNLPEVTLYVNGSRVETQRGEKIFRFSIPLSDTADIRAVGSGAGVTAEDQMQIRHVEKSDPSYLAPGSQVTNWFDRDDEIARKGYFSILNSVNEVKDNPQAKAVYDAFMAPLMEKVIKKYGDVAKSVKTTPEMQRRMDEMSVRDSLRQIGSLASPELVRELNAKLNEVPNPAAKERV